MKHCPIMTTTVTRSINPMATKLPQTKQVTSKLLRETRWKLSNSRNSNEIFKEPTNYIVRTFKTFIQFQKLQSYNMYVTYSSWHWHCFHIDIVFALTLFLHSHCFHIDIVFELTLFSHWLCFSIVINFTLSLFSHGIVFTLT